ncbi:MAG: sporulation protein YunB, partial [Bacilli bacterium]
MLLCDNMGKIKMRLRDIYALIFIILIFFSIIILYYINKKGLPVMMNYAQIQTRRLGIEILRSAAIEKVNKKIRKNELVIVTKNNNGEIVSVDFDSVIANETLVIVAKAVREKLKKIEDGQAYPSKNYIDTVDKSMAKRGIVYEIPLGIIFGNSLLTNVGPKIPVKVSYSGSISTDIKTRVSEYGLNSALIEVFVKVEINQKTIIPFMTEETALTSEIPIVMKVV